MRANSFISNILIALLPVIFMTTCAKRSNPLLPTGSGHLGIQLSFKGRNITKADALGKLSSTLSGNQAINKISIRVLESVNGNTLASTEIDIQPGQESFAADLTVPTGENRIIEVEALEQFNNSSTITYRGRRDSIRVPADSTITVAIEIFPIPIPDRRIVLYVGDGSGMPGSQGNQVPIFLTNLNSVRGIQFDLIYNGNSFLPNTVDGNDIINSFSNIEARILESGRYRVLIFDQSSNPPAEIPPVTDTLSPVPLVDILMNVNIQTSAGVTETLRLENAVATDSNLNNLEVFAVPGNFSIQ